MIADNELNINTTDRQLLYNIRELLKEQNEMLKQLLPKKEEPKEEPKKEEVKKSEIENNGILANDNKNQKGKVIRNDANKVQKSTKAGK